MVVKTDTVLNLHQALCRKSLAQWLGRAGAMLRSLPENEVYRLAGCARWERGESVVRSIAESGVMYEPTNR